MKEEQSEPKMSPHRLGGTERSATIESLNKPIAGLGASAVSLTYCKPSAKLKFEDGE